MNKKDKFLLAVVTEPSITKACNTVGISKSSGYRYLKEPEFQKGIEEMKASLLDGAINTLRGNLAKCADELLSISLDKGIAPQIRVNAIQQVFTIFRQCSEIADIEKKLNELAGEWEKMKRNDNELGVIEGYEQIYEND